MTAVIVEEPKSPDPNPVSDEKFVIDRILRQLGTPKELVRIHAKKVWKNQYRVNVFCNVESNRPVKTVAITDSFFVAVKEGEIVTQPAIVRKYK